MARVLIIDDDTRLAQMLKTYLEDRGLEVVCRHDVRTGTATLNAGGFDALVLDVNLPDGDGFGVLRALRPQNDIPVIMLTARGDELDRIVGLEMGADDYLPKPFNPRELVARLNAVLRRGRVSASDVLRFGNLVVDRGARVAAVDGTEASLTSRQFEILLALAERAGRVVTRDQLMLAVLGEELDAFDRSIDVHISRIRAVIEDDPKRPRRIRTVRGVGYLFVDSP